MGRVSYPGIADAKPDKNLKDGAHDLTIVKVERVPAKGHPESEHTRVMLVDKTVPDSKAVFFYLIDPISLETYIERSPGKSEEDYKKSENFKALTTKQFCTVFDIEFDEAGYDTDDFLGKVASLRTKQTKDDLERTNVELILPEVL